MKYMKYLMKLTQKLHAFHRFSRGSWESPAESLPSRVFGHESWARATS